MLIDQLHRIDQAITLYLNSFNSPAMDEFWQVVTTQEVWYPMYGIIAGCLIWRLGWKRGLIVIASIALCVGICDQSANFMKAAVGRLRPGYSAEMVLGGLNVLEARGGFYGFFSGHASNAFSMAVCMILGFRNDKSRTYRAFEISILVWASFVAISRVFAGKHYLGDILAGTIIGICVGYMMGKLATYVIRKWVRVPAEPSPSASPVNPSQES